MSSHHLKKAVIIAFAVIGLLCLAVLIITPYLIDLGIERWIASQGPEIARVENIDFNPFTGSLVMDNLVVETRGGRTFNISRASVNFSWKQLFRKQLYLQELVLRDAFMLVDHLDERGLRVGGLILRELAGSGEKSDTPGWEVGVQQFILQNAQIEYDTPELKATYFIDNYTLSGLETWNKQKPVKMAFQGRINDSPVQVDAEVMPFAATKSWKGSLVLKEGSLELASRVRGLQEYAPAGTVDLDLALDAKKQENGAINLDIEGTVALKSLQLQYEQYGLQQELFNWKGKAAVEQHGEDLRVEMSSDLNGTGFQIIDKVQNRILLRLAGFTASGMEIAGLDNIRVAQVDLEELGLVEALYDAEQQEKEAKGPLLKTALITISDLNLHNNKDSSIAEIQVQDAEALIHRDKDGNWLFASPVLTSETDTEGSSPVEKVAEEEKSQPLNFQLDRLLVSGKSFVSFEDETLPRPFQTVFHIDELALSGIRTVDAAEPAGFNMKGRVGDYGTVTFEGAVKSSDSPITFNTTGTISALDMVPFSSYTGRAIGYNVTSGQMDADINITIDKGMLDGLFGLRMRNLEVAQVDPVKEPEIDKQMDVPLESALSMLRNKKDEINLDLELKGDIRNPEFGIQDAINQALAKAMQFATLSYLKYTLQPFGTYIAIAEVVGKAGKEMSKVGLDPVMFPVGETSLDDNAAQYLAKVKDVLENRPKLRIELCGKAVEKDRAALAEQRLAAQQKAQGAAGMKKETPATAITITDDVLQDLAQERAKTVKETLVKQHGIDHQRIYICLSALAEDPDKAPMVELLLD